jgi:predicted permease
MVWSKVEGNRNVSAVGDFLDWKQQSTVFQDLNAWSGRGVSLSMGERPERLQATVTTPGFVSMMGHRFLLGRDFLPEEGEVGKDQVVVLTNRVWQQRFGADREIVGRQVRIDAKPHTVVGVLAPGPADRVQGLDLYLPLAFTPDQMNHNFHWLLVMGRLRPGVTVAQANAQMEGIAKRIADAFPDQKKGWQISVEPLHNNFLSRNTINALWFLLAGVGFVLLIACANVANLLLARGAARQREVALRSSLGASPRQIATQFLAESLLLALLGGLFGLGLAVAIMRAILAVMPAYTLPSEVDVRLSIPVLLFTVAAVIGSGILFGCAPAWQAIHSNLSENLKEGARGTTGGRHRVQRALVVAEFALALTLLAGGGLAIHSLMNLSRVDLGFRTERLLTFFLPVPSERLKGAERVTLFYNQLEEKLRALPGVEAVTIATGGPLRGGFGMGVDIVGRPRAQGAARDGAAFIMATPDYFRTYGLPILKGRALTPQDDASSPRVAVVNESFVQRHFKDVDPLSQRLLVDELVPGESRVGKAVEWQVVGVVRGVKNRGARDEVRPEIDVPFAQSPWPSAGVTVRSTGDPNTVRSGIGAVIQQTPSPWRGPCATRMPES